MARDTLFSGESKNIEYKITLPDKSEKYMKTIVAFANTQGGKLIVGIDDKYYYVAESLDSYLGLEVKRYKIDEAEEDWTFIMLLDEVYKEDGNYTDMWY